MNTKTEKLEEALREICAQTDGRNSSHIGQDRAHAIALQTLREVERDGEKKQTTMKTPEEITKQLNDAVSVIILSPEIRKFLTVVDPKALQQCFDAFNAYRNADKGSPFDGTEWSEITEAAWFAMRHHFSDLAGYLDVSDEYLETLKAKLNNHLNSEE